MAEVGERINQEEAGLALGLPEFDQGVFIGEDARLLATEVHNTAGRLMRKLQILERNNRLIKRTKDARGEPATLLLHNENLRAVLRHNGKGEIERLTLVAKQPQKTTTYLEFDFRVQPKLSVGKKEADGSVVLEEYGLSDRDEYVLARVTVCRPLAKGAPNKFMQAVQTFRGVVGDDPSIHTRNFLDGDRIVLSVGGHPVPAEQFGDLGRVPLKGAVRAVLHEYTSPAPVQQDIRVLPDDVDIEHLTYRVHTSDNVFRLEGERPKSGYVAFAGMLAPSEVHTEDYLPRGVARRSLALHPTGHPEMNLGFIPTKNSIGLERLGVGDHLQALVDLL